ncbi:MAG: 2-oxoacid:ferredoxin oxidoreductase subunit beta [Candidatus Omnitrophica bacterium]|nr:2-oxoacid:ferredoxin oxidoreductase subunit beta [Candidatus Omnitrophota bacterium]
MNIDDFKSNDQVAWCPGCGDFGILTAVKKALAGLNREPKDILFVSGIGQAAKLPHYVKSNCFNGLHGRALPVAVGAKIANPALTVIVTSGDGDCYGEGGNHLMHNIRRNADITVIVHNNQIYGLTKGQASPTTDEGQQTPVQVDGVVLEPLRPLELALALGAGFVARGFAGEMEHLSRIIIEAVNHKGFSLIDVLQPCTTFNKVNTFEWYRQRVYKLNDDNTYDFTDKFSAYQKAAEWPKRIPIGVIYKIEKKTYEEKTGISAKPALIESNIQDIDISRVLKDFA